MFPDKELIRNIQNELDQIIHLGIQNLVKLLQKTNQFDSVEEQINSSSSTLITKHSMINIDDEQQINELKTINNENQRSELKLNETLKFNRKKLLSSYLNALKSQSEQRGIQFNSDENLIQQLIDKGLINQKSIDSQQKKSFQKKIKKT